MPQLLTAVQCFMGFSWYYTEATFANDRLRKFFRCSFLLSFSVFSVLPRLLEEKKVPQIKCVNSFNLTTLLFTFRILVCFWHHSPIQAIHDLIKKKKPVLVYIRDKQGVWFFSRCLMIPLQSVHLVEDHIHAGVFSSCACSVVKGTTWNGITGLSLLTNV